MYCANRDAADAAKSAAKTADQAMHISERAYLFIDHPVFNLGMKSVFLPITNSGRIPSGRVEITTHYVVANLKSQTQPKVELKDSSEHRKAVLEYESISTGTPITTNQTLNTVDVKRVTAGVQRIYVVGYITYNDGFPETPIQKYTFCMDEGANRIRGDIEITSCDFATYMAMIDPLPEH
jgi:hypothetical protein